MVEWIEMIPFNETRLYVQRVLENLQIYRGQDTNNVTAFSPARDSPADRPTPFQVVTRRLMPYTMGHYRALQVSPCPILNYTVGLMRPTSSPIASATRHPDTSPPSRQGPGPHVVVAALTHGNEICGAIALDRLFRAKIRPRRGARDLGLQQCRGVSRIRSALPDRVALCR
jgi:hypothetical protein